MTDPESPFPEVPMRPFLFLLTCLAGLLTVTPSQACPVVSGSLGTYAYPAPALGAPSFDPGCPTGTYGTGFGVNTFGAPLVVRQRFGTFGAFGVVNPSFGVVGGFPQVLIGGGRGVIRGRVGVVGGGRGRAVIRQRGAVRRR